MVDDGMRLADFTSLQGERRADEKINTYLICLHALENNSK